MNELLGINQAVMDDAYDEFGLGFQFGLSGCLGCQLVGCEVGDMLLDYQETTSTYRAKYQLYDSIAMYADIGRAQFTPQVCVLCVCGCGCVGGWVGGGGGMCVCCVLCL